PPPPPPPLPVLTLVPPPPPLPPDGGPAGRTPAQLVVRASAATKESAMFRGLDQRPSSIAPLHFLGNFSANLGRRDRMPYCQLVGAALLLNQWFTEPQCITPPWQMQPRSLAAVES